MTSYLLVLFLLTPNWKAEYVVIPVAHYATNEACEAAGLRATAYGKNYNCIPVMKDGKLGE
jgi:hypothetical protein